MYVVVRGLKDGNDRVHYEIKEKDILKLGRVKYAVKAIGRHTPEPKDPSPFSEKGNASNSIFCQQNNEDQFEEIKKVEALCSPKEVQERNQAEGEEIKCKFCWTAEASAEDPLLNSCSCKGGLAFIHLSCLRAW
jgi:hypothetical protein